MRTNRQNSIVMSILSIANSHFGMTMPQSHPSAWICYALALGGIYCAIDYRKKMKKGLK